MNKLMVPTVHLNGTSKEALLSEYVTAMNAVQDAIDALKKVTVHGRDYYPQGDRAINDAMLQRARQFEHLEEVHTELEAIAVEISEQGK